MFKIPNTFVADASEVVENIDTGRSVWMAVVKVRGAHVSDSTTPFDIVLSSIGQHHCVVASDPDRLRSLTNANKITILPE